MSAETDQAAGWPADVPDTVAVADALEVEPDQLVHFVDYHPNVSLGAVLGWATADPAEHEDTVAAWLTAYRERATESLDVDEHHSAGHSCGLCGETATAHLQGIGYRCGDCHPAAPKRHRDTPGGEQ